MHRFGPVQARGRAARTGQALHADFGRINAATMYVFIA
jgi:hypothetical protein